MQILLKKKTSDDVKKNFASIFPTNYVTRFITFHSMMTETGARYPFIIMNTDRLDLHPKNKSFYLTVLVLRGSKNFCCKTIEKY